MASLALRAGLWCSFVVVVVAVYFGLQQPLLESSTSDSPSQTFCYAGGVTAKFSTNTSASCFTIKDGEFTDVFTTKSEPPVELHAGHAIPGLWDGVGYEGPFIHLSLSQGLTFG